MYIELDEYLNSHETKKTLKVSDCELAHIRNLGKLQFIRKGNSYLYLKDSIISYKLNKK